MHIDYIAQYFPKAWTTFILDKSDGSTRHGVERKNNCVRTYCLVILNSRPQFKSAILRIGPKRVSCNIEDGIQRPVDLPSQITLYQTTLKYARSKVDYVFRLYWE